MKIHILAFILSVLLITSCGTTKTSGKDQSDFHSGKKAIIKTENVPLLAGMVFGEMPIAKIEAIDSKKIKKNRLALDKQIAVEIGFHVIEFSCSDRASKDKGYNTESIKLELKPFHEYIVDCDEEFNIRVKEKKIR